jgi:hypothetical protein
MPYEFVSAQIKLAKKIVISALWRKVQKSEGTETARATRRRCVRRVCARNGANEVLTIS